MGDRAQLAQAYYPRQGVGEPTFKRWGKPTLPSSPVEEARRTLAGMPLPPAAACSTPSGKCRHNVLPAMDNLRCEGHFARSIVDDSYTGYFTARIKFETERLGVGIGNGMLQDDGEREPAKDCCPPLTQQDARSRRAAGHKGIVVCVYNKN